MTLAECFSLCRADPKCDAIRVDWFTIPNNFTAMRVGCGLRGGIDLAKCAVQTPISAQSPHAVQYTTFSVDAPAKSQLVVATVALVGYLPVVRNSGNDWVRLLLLSCSIASDLAGLVLLLTSQLTRSCASGW